MERLSWLVRAALIAEAVLVIQAYLHGEELRTDGRTVFLGVSVVALVLTAAVLPIHDRHPRLLQCLFVYTWMFAALIAESAFEEAIRSDHLLSALKASAFAALFLVAVIGLPVVRLRAKGLRESSSR